MPSSTSILGEVSIFYLFRPALTLFQTGDDHTPRPSQRNMPFMSRSSHGSSIPRLHSLRLASTAWLLLARPWAKTSALGLGPAPLPVPSSEPIPALLISRLRFSRTLAHAFPEAQLSVSLAVDGTVFASDVYAASHIGMVSSGGRSISSRKSTAKWGGRAVLILVNIRLGIDNVNPIYYEALKVGTTPCGTICSDLFPVSVPLPSIRWHLGRTSIFILLFRWHTSR